MLILGIDPGTATTGYGFIQDEGPNDFKVVEWGLIETDKETEPSMRLHEIYSQMNDLILKFKPDVLIMEKVFFATNAKTVIRVGQAQGVILLCAAKAQVKVFEYAPGTIKKIISGSGRANKKEMQKAVRKILGPKVRSEKHKKTHFDNAADALAIAVTHIYKSNGIETAAI
ncbi:MAG TPA: crossover junction endodeoxyribonuclease RuvC [Patescibacteria group bacterium]